MKIDRITDDPVPCPNCGRDIRGNCALHISTAHGVQFLIECLSCGHYTTGEQFADDDQSS